MSQEKKKTNTITTTGNNNEHAQREVKVSVLMPAYNAGEHIAEAIESILSQTFTDLELIIMDDGSHDRTWEIIKEKASRDQRIIAIQSRKNQGVSRTRNLLIKRAVGDYIVWQDADDVSLPARIEHQYLAMEDDQCIGICGGYMEFFDDKSHIKSTKKYYPDDARLRSTIFRYMPISQGASMIRKKCFFETGFFPEDTDVAEDLAVVFQIGTKYKFANLQEVVLRYRKSTTGLTFTKLRLMELYTLFLREKYWKHPAYSTTYSDYIYNTLQAASVYIIAPRFKIALFNFFRNS